MARPPIVLRLLPVRVQTPAVSRSAITVRVTFYTVGKPLSQDTRFEYDLAGRATSQMSADLRETGFGYDANGSITFLTPPGKEPITSPTQK